MFILNRHFPNKIDQAFMTLISQQEQRVSSMEKYKTKLDILFD
jgi:hypothetical protein